MPPIKGTIKGKAGQAKKGTLKRLLKILFKNYKWSLIVCMICMVISTIANLSASIVTKNILEAIVKWQERDCIDDFKDVFYSFNPDTGIMFWIVFMASIYAVAIFTTWYWNRTMAITTQKYLNTLRIEMFDHMETLPIKYFDTHAHGDIMSLYTNDVDTIRQLVSQSLPALFTTAASIIFSFSYMLYTSFYLTLIVVIGTISVVFVVKFIGGRSSRFFVKQQISMGLVEGNIQESINGLKVIKVFSHEEKSLEDFKVLNNELCYNATIGNRAGNIMGPIIGNIGNIMYVIIPIIGSIMSMNGVVNASIETLFKGGSIFNIATVLAFLPMTRMFTNNLNNFSQQITFIVMGLAGASRIFDLLDEKEEADDGYVSLVHIKYNEDGSFEETNERTRFYAWRHPHQADGTVTYTELKGDIVLDQVDFSYNEEKQILFDISVYAHPGQKIALVGATGAGKTTITNLLNRFYSIQDGKIRYDGININKIKKDDLRHALGIVLQDVNLFTGTVMDNIRYGRLDATDEECIEAAKIANAHDFITRLPEGYNTMLTGSGANLSQGQRQLISIARAAVADTPVLILDEATSSIDTRTEKLVQQGMDKLMEGRTVFVIAHRLSTIQNSDCIMVMDHGYIIERGSHDDLIAEHGKYYQLYTGAFELE